MNSMCEDIKLLIDDFTNLVIACEYKKVEFDSVDGFTLDDCKNSINEVLTVIFNYDDEMICRYWEGN